jgi:DNA polymerase III subunit alpha
MSDSSNPADLHHNLEASLKTPKRFAHLHQHTQYSLLDGAARIKDLLKWVAKTSPTNPTVAMTDHGNMHGAVQFFKYAGEYNVKPIIGYEAYVSAGSRFDRKMEKGVEGGYYHLTLLAKNFEGYQNLCKLSSIAYLEGYYYKPRIDREVLALHHKGVIAMSGCLGAEVPNLILQDRLEEAEERLKWYQALFKEDYYIEIQNHGLPEQQKVNPVLKAWAIKHGIGMVATNDGHYVKHEDAYAHEVLLAIQTKALMSEEKRFKFSCDDFYVKTQLEMEKMLPSSDWGDEIYDNSINIADKCNLELPIGNKRVYQMPALPIPEGRSMAEELRVQVFEGSLKRYPKDLTENLYRHYVQVSLEKLDPEGKSALLKRIPNLEPETANFETLILAMAFMGTIWVEQFKDEKYTQYPGLDWLEEHESDAWGQGLIVLRRAEYESGVIIRMGFPDYFLIVADFINWAKDQNIRVGPGRGSGAGSLVAYALRITNLDPLYYGLLFERFLNPDRVSMPDFDVDFSDTRRNEVIEYVRNKYGDDKVAMIATFGTMASRAVFKDVARVLELPFAEADKLSKLVPVKFGKSLSLEDAAKTVPDIAAMLEENEKTKEVFGIAQSLEGLTRHASVHASGVIIGRERLDNLVPLMRDSSGEGVVCQLDMSSVEDIGLIKMDFLGLRTLSFLEEAMRIVKESKGVSLEPDDFPLDDSKTYDLISRGETKGVFQLEGGGITEAAKRLKPRRIQDVNALSALYRPGPMDNIPAYIERHHGREEVRYDQGEFDLPTCEPLLKPILEETYGIPVYQEQIMQIASAVAGYSLGQSDLLRRAMGKKKLEEMNKERIKFEEGALNVNKIPKKESNRLFDILEKFANYGFNKCLIGNTIVHSSEGIPFTMQSLFENQNFIELATLEEGFSLGCSRVVGVFENGIKPVFELQTSLGKTLTATGNHPLFTLNGWKNLEDLKIGDRIASPAKLPIEGTKTWDQHLLVTLGWVLSEGNTCHPCGFYVYTQNQESLDDIVNASRGFLDTQATVKLRTDRNNVFDVYFGTGKRGIAGRSGARLWLESLGIVGLNALEKHFPDQVFELCNADLAVLIGRFWSGDGFVFGNKMNTTPYFATSSEKMAIQLQHLLLRFGIVSRVTKKLFKYKEGRIGFTVHILGRRSIQAFKDYIVPHLIGRTAQVELLNYFLKSIPENRESIDTLPPEIKAWVVSAKNKSGKTWIEIETGSGVCVKEFYGSPKAYKKGFRRDTILRLADYFQDSRLENACSQDVFWETITGIEPAGEVMTYDLEVENSHNFVANDIIVHNSHSAAYAFISFQTAYIKAHYPVEFMAALLTVERKDSDKVAEYINDARQLKLESGNKMEVLPPDINLCSSDFKVVGEKILFGLFAVKGLGEESVLAILEERQKNGAFKGLANFCSRLQHVGLTRRWVENLVKAGAFDAFGIRQSLLESVEDALDYAAGQAQMANQGMDALFGMATIAPEPKLRVIPPAQTEDEARARAIQQLQFEKEAVGLYISGHPLEHYPGMLEAASTKAPNLEHWFHNSGAVAGYRGRKKAVLAGMISGVQRKPTKSGGMMARVNLTDDVGSLELVAFSRAYEKINTKLVEDMPALVVVEVEPDGEGIRVSIEDVLTFDEARAMPKILSLELDLEEVGETQLEKLDEILQNQDGIPNTPIRVRVRSEVGYEIWELEVKATPNTSETLRLECPWLQPKLGINGDAVLAKYERAAKPWEKKAQGGEARVLN